MLPGIMQSIKSITTLPSLSFESLNEVTEEVLPNDVSLLLAQLIMSPSVIGLSDLVKSLRTANVYALINCQTSATRDKLKVVKDGHIRHTH